MKARSWHFHDPRQASAEANLLQNETILGGRTLLVQPSPIGTSGRIEDKDIVPCGCLFPLAGNWQVGSTLGRVVLPARQSCLPRRLSLPHPIPSIPPIWQSCATGCSEGTLHLAHNPSKPGPDRSYNPFRATTVLEVEK